MKNLNYSIGDTAKQVGVTQKQIRNWEAKGYIPKSERIVSGDRAYRRFSPGQVEIIRSIKEYLDQGFKLQTAVQKATGTTISKTEVNKNA